MTTLHACLSLSLTCRIQPSESESVKEAMVSYHLHHHCIISLSHSSHFLLLQAHLQKQLDVLLTSKTGMQQKNNKLHEEIQGLTDQVKRLRDENVKLKQIVDETASGQQASQLHDRNKALEEENLKLKTELKNLKSSLSLLVKGSSESSSVDALQSNTQHT